MDCFWVFCLVLFGFFNEEVRISIVNIFIELNGIILESLIDNFNLLFKNDQGSVFLARHALMQAF